MADSPLADEIQDVASGPAQVAGDQGSMRQHSLKDLIEADRYLASQDAQQTDKGGFSIRRFKAPGPV